MADFTVTFQPSGISVTVPEGETLLAAASAAGLFLQSPCGGQGGCGKCRVQAGGELTPSTPQEEQALSTGLIATEWRLACQARVLGNVHVIVPDSSLVTSHRIMVEGAIRELIVDPPVCKRALTISPPSVDDPRSDLTRVVDALGDRGRLAARLSVLRTLPQTLRTSAYQCTAVTSDDCLIAVEPGDTTTELYGLAVDIGTTTVVAYLCRLTTGECVAVASDLNSQAQFGDDVISRIRVAMTEDKGLHELNRAIITVLNDLVEQTTHQAGICRDRIYELTVVGNTCMSHLFLGVPPAGLGTLPFGPSFQTAQTVRATELGISVHPEARVYVVPNIGGFVGADTVGVMLASELDDGGGLRVAVDIGTNGEIIVARDGRLYAASTAAGPAFEGAKITQGMRAGLGAIDRVHLDAEVHCHVIGDVRARGLCGSGLVDAVAELVRMGIVTPTGRMLAPSERPSLPAALARRIIQSEDGLEFVLAWPEESYGEETVTLTAKDIRELQLAKAAIYAGIELLLEEVGADPRDIDEFLLAGAFGNYIRRESATAIGLIPSVPPERIRPIGNAAGVGARLALCSRSERQRAEELASRTHHVELSGREGFYDRFADAMMLQPLPVVVA